METRANYDRSEHIPMFEKDRDNDLSNYREKRLYRCLGPIYHIFSILWICSIYEARENERG